MVLHLPYSGWIGIWKCWSLRKGENWSTQIKTLSEQGREPHVQMVWATLVGGECSPSPHMFQAKHEIIKMAGYWPTVFGIFIDRDEIEVDKSAEKNEANIQPSCPHVCGLKHNYMRFYYVVKKRSFTRGKNAENAKQAWWAHLSCSSSSCFVTK